MGHGLTDAELGRLRGEIGDAVRWAGIEVILPRFRKLARGNVTEKAPGSVVTEVDREVEALLSGALGRLIRGSLVVGEEAASADPALLDRLGEGFVWLVDPLDGTSNYVAGDRRFATMVALLHDGEPLIGYIHAPAEGRTSLSTRGARPRAVRKGMTPPVGSAFARYFAEPLRAQVEARMAVLPTVSEGGRCVGCEYQDIVAGKQDFALFWRSMPWDHAAGSLLVQGSGGYIAYLDDTPYRPGARRFGLLAACDEPTWRFARSMLVEGVDDPAGLLVREHDDY